jgi:hypothetical protein
LIAHQPLETQFQAFFPALTEQSWPQLLGKRNFELNELPYQLKVENNAKYLENCHFCASQQCKTNCPVPFSAQLTVLDMLHRVGAEDNVSFYNNRQGKQDFILNVVWQRDFDKNFIKHLSGMELGKRIDLRDGEDDAKLH